MGQFGRYSSKKIEKMAEKLYTDMEDNGIKKQEFDVVQTSEIHVKITENQIVITGKSLINGHDYQPIKQTLRRKDDEDLFEVMVITYQALAAFADGTADELL